MEKRCCKCNKVKPIDDFPIDNSRSDGHYVYCRLCVRIRSRVTRSRKRAQKITSMPEKFQALDGEIFKDIKGYVGHYKISNFGRCISIKSSGMIIEWSIGKRGYATVCLSKDNKKKTITVHSLVLSAFVSDRPQGLVVNHKDGDKLNNQLQNLEWVTLKENALHSYYVLGNTAHCTPPRRYGADHPISISASQANDIKSAYEQPGSTSRKVAKEFGVSKTTVLAIVKNKHWSNRS